MTALDFFPVMRKFFIVDTKVKRRNETVVYKPGDSEVPVVGKTKFPVNIHILSVASSESDVMPSHLFQNGHEGSLLADPEDSR